MKTRALLAVLLLLTAAVYLFRLGYLQLPLVPRAHAQEANMMNPMDTPLTVDVTVFNDKGDLVPIVSPKIYKTDAKWRELLTDDQYHIMRSSGTEQPFCGNLLDNKKEGVYTCAACGLPLFSSDSKFKSGTGWPSFFKPVALSNIEEISDESLGMVRTEIRCARCGGHLGHVFNDGPKPTGLRYCLNSESLKFTDAKDVAKLADPFAYQPAVNDQDLATAVFAGGCFWCTEAVYEPLEGVTEVTSGYAGGTKDDADYQAVSTGTTGHAESIRITYDPKKISYTKLLEVFFLVAHDPTQLNRQGNDVGRQYRSAVFVADDAQRAATQAYIDMLNDTGWFDAPIVTTIEPLTQFFPAETYHQNYVEQHPDQPYVKAVSIPKVKKLEEHYGKLISKDKRQEVEQETGE